MNVDEWRSQIKRGTLEYCVMLLVSRRDRYGYEIMSELGRFPIVAVKESTTYPLLRRLEREGHLGSYWAESMEGVPPRKYYAITAKGAEYVRRMSAEWKHLVEAIRDFEGE